MSYVEHLFMCLLATKKYVSHKEVCLLWRNVCLDLFPTYWLSCLFCWYWVDELLDLEINPLSVASFAIIFPHSEGCLFTMFVVSFAVWKLLSLMRSHLFIFISITLVGGHRGSCFMSSSILPVFSCKGFIVSG